MQLRTGVDAARLTLKGWEPAVITVVTFLAVGVFRLPIVPVVCIIGPLSVALSWRKTAPVTKEEA
jgi:hypothetical protein